MFALTIALIFAHPVAWYCMGGGWAGAFKAPFGVMVPGTALVLAHATLFDGFMALPSIFSGTLKFEALVLFLLACLWTASRALAQEAKVKVAVRPKARAPNVNQQPQRNSYLLRQAKEIGAAPMKPLARPGRTVFR